MSARDERANRRNARRQGEAQAEPRAVGERRNTASVFHSLRQREQSASRIIPLRGESRQMPLLNDPPQPEEGPYDFCWGAVFVHLLWTRLGRVQPFLRDLRISDFSDTQDHCVQIESGMYIEGTNIERLNIELFYNHPAFGFSMYEATENDWSARTQYDRNERIRLRPYEVFSHMHHVLPRTSEELETNAIRSARLVGFQAFTHGAYRIGTGDLRLAIFHADYNTSEPVVLLVVNAIREYYRRAAGGPPAPPAPPAY